MKKEREKPMPGVVLFVVLYLSLVLTTPFTRRLILLIIWPITSVSYSLSKWMEPVTHSLKLLDLTLLKLLPTNTTPMSSVLRLVLAVESTYNVTLMVPPIPIPKSAKLKVSLTNSRLLLLSSIPLGNGLSNFSITFPTITFLLLILIRMVSLLFLFCVVTIGEVRIATTSIRMSILVSRTSLVTKLLIITVMVSGVLIQSLADPTRMPYALVLNIMVSLLWVIPLVLTSKFLLPT